MAELMLIGLLFAFIPLTALALILGFILPASSTEKIEEALPYPSAQIWKLVSDLPGYADWLNYVVRMDCEDEAQQIWLQTSRIFSFRLRVLEKIDGSLIRFELMPPTAAEKHSYLLGQRTIQLHATGPSQTTVMISQRHKANGPFLRTYMFYFRGVRHPARTTMDCLKRTLQAQAKEASALASPSP